MIDQWHTVNIQMLGIGNDIVIAFTLITFAIADTDSDKLQGGCNNNSCLHTFF